MNKMIKYFGFVLVVSLMTSCVTTFGPSRAAYDLGYTARPVYEGESTSSIQAAGQYNSDDGFNGNEVQNGGEASISYHRIYESMGFSLGAFGYTSKYRIRSTDQALSAYGYGGRASIYKNQLMGNWQWRPYGLELGFSVEEGQYASFRQSLTEGTKASTATMIPSLGISSELIYLPDFLDHSSIGARLTIGSSFYRFEDNNNYFQPLISLSPFLQWDRYSAYANLKFDQRFGASVGASFRLNK